MRELERDLPATALDATPSAPALAARLIVVGPGRAGSSLAAAAQSADLGVTLLARDDEFPELDADGTALLLCVPDDAIAKACERIAPELPAGIAVGHVSGATPLTALDAAARRGCPVFSLHPLQTIPSRVTPLTGTPCALAGSAGGIDVARELARRLGMRPFEVAEENRATYHAAASMASNFLVALEESAAELLEAAGVDEPREVLAPLVLRTAANWADAGAGALTGPIARGDEATVAQHLAALTAEAPELKPLYEVLAERTRALVDRREESA
jgi:predicted short-subunit dehydrogenase-like oxidoreductase (DUF2520 family)